MDARGRRSSAGAWALLILVLGMAAAASAYHGLPRIGNAPPFTLVSTGYENGVQGTPTPFTLADYRGQPVVLDMMAVRCSGCIELTKEVLKPLAAAHPGLAIVSIDIWSDPAFGAAGETESDLVALQQAEGVGWRHARDTDHVSLAYGVTALPRILVLDGTGGIVLSRTGIPPLGVVEEAVRSAATGAGSRVAFVSAGLPGMAVLSGLLSVLSPCSIGLLPAYLGLLLGSDANGAPAATPTGTTGLPMAAPPLPARAQATALRARRRPILSGILLGLAAAAGILAFYLLLALALAGLAAAGLAAWVGLRLPVLGVAVAVLLIAIGVLTAVGFDWSRALPWLRRVGPGPRRGHPLARSGAFGIAYGAAAFGCTGPALMPVLLLGFARGPAVGLAMMGLYAAAVAGLAVTVAVLVSLGRDSWLRGLARRGRGLQVLAGVLMVASGAYLLRFGAGAIL